jgi:arsenate reductase
MTRKVVLFACVHNSGRSVAARVLAEHYAQGAIDVRSAGSEPARGVNPVVSRVLAERGLSTARETPTLLDDDLVRVADVVVTMGCGETCPIFPGKRYEDWRVDDPAGQDEETIRRIVADLDVRVRRLLITVGVPVGEDPLVPSRATPASPTPRNQSVQRA